ncbi:MAG: YHS domain-containing protein [Sedimentisphaerales bacterium]|nr:YHS domain-containing protein [Sedimentisphaerales bacterium]
MILKTRNINLLAISYILISFLLILSNGCKKSEPTGTNATNNMSSMNHDMEGMENMPTEAVTAENGQAVCPVMKGNPINLDIFAEYQGKKVYFCCAECKAAFLENPEKYVAELPQFNKQEN